MVSVLCCIDVEATANAIGAAVSLDQDARYVVRLDKSGVSHDAVGAEAAC